MVAHALALVAVAALATAGVGGVVVYTDLQEFDLHLSVVDALTDKPIAGASVQVKDANGVLVASGLTDDDGEYELSIDNQGTDDSDQDANESPGVQEAEDNATLAAVDGPLTVTVSMTGYETQTITVNLDTWNDEDLEIQLVPTAT